MTLPGVVVTLVLAAALGLAVRRCSREVTSGDLRNLFAQPNTDPNLDAEHIFPPDELRRLRNAQAELERARLARIEVAATAPATNPERKRP